MPTLRRKRELTVAQQVPPRPPPRRQKLSRHSPALLQTQELCSSTGQDKSSLLQVGCVCSHTPSCTSTSHAAASASCRAVPASHTTSQASCGGGVAASLSPSPSKASASNLLQQKLELVWQESPSVPATCNFLQLHGPSRSKGQLLSEAVPCPALAVTLHHKPSTTSPSYKHFTLLQLLAQPDREAELFQGNPQAHCIPGDRNGASLHTLPWKTPPNTLPT